MSDFSAIIDTNFVLITNYQTFPLHKVFWSNTLIKYETWISSYPTPFYADMQRAVPGTSSYWVMPSNTAISNFSIFWNRAQVELIYFPISAAMFSIMSTDSCDKFRSLYSGYSSFSQLTCEFSIAFFELSWFQTTTDTKRTSEILRNLLAHTKTPHNTTHKIASLYFEFKYHFSTLQKTSGYFWTRVYKFELHCRSNEAQYYPYYKTIALNWTFAKFQSWIKIQNFLNCY